MLTVETKPILPHYLQVLQYRQRCADLETQMVETPEQPSSLKPVSYQPSPIATSSALEQAQLHLRELREERIGDLETALRKLDEERRK